MLLLSETEVLEDMMPSKSLSFVNAATREFIKVL